MSSSGPPPGAFTASGGGPGTWPGETASSMTTFGEVSPAYYEPYEDVAPTRPSHSSRETMYSSMRVCKWNMMDKRKPAAGTCSPIPPLLAMQITVTQRKVHRRSLW